MPNDANDTKRRKKPKCFFAPFRFQKMHQRTHTHTHTFCFFSKIFFFVRSVSDAYNANSSKFRNQTFSILFMVSPRAIDSVMLTKQPKHMLNTNDFYLINNPNNVWHISKCCVSQHLWTKKKTNGKTKSWVFKHLWDNREMVVIILCSIYRIACVDSMKCNKTNRNRHHRKEKQ